MESIKNTQLYQLTYTFFLETIREPEVLFWGILFPVLISIGLGLAFTQTSESKFHIMIVEENQTELDSLLNIYAVHSLKNEKETFTWKIEDKIIGNTEFNFARSDWKSAIVSLKRGESELIVADSVGKIRYHFDPLNSQAQLAYMKLSALIKSPASTTDTGQNQVNPLTLKGVRYIDFLIPGILSLGVMSSILWGISYTIIERRSRKLLRRMVATPMR